jgi:hypothetical protein
MRTTKASVGCIVLVALVGCMEASDGSEEQISTTLQAAKSADDDGTELSATAEATAPVCLDSDTAAITVSGFLTTTGSVDSADITLTVDGAPTATGTIEPGDFAHDGRVKTAPYSFDLTLENGTHTIEVCFVQSGAPGREPKEVCAAPITVVIDCSDEPDHCKREGFFGDIVANPVLCGGAGTPHIPVHVSGELGEVVTITIEGPNDFELEGLMNHAGESCNYHYNWDTRDGNHGGPGSYTVTVVGENGSTFVTTPDLLCE